MSQAIEAWLAAPTDFAAGVALYAAAGGAGVYGQLFALGETSYSRHVLVAQLGRLVSIEPQRNEKVAEPATDNPQLTTDNITPDPAALADVRARLKQARDERSQLHAQLTAPRLHRAIRGTMAQCICALTTLVGELLTTEAHLLATGRLPGPVATAELVDAGELRRRLSNAISRRAKLRHRPDRAAELPALETEIILIREKLTLSDRV